MLIGISATTESDSPQDTQSTLNAGQTIAYFPCLENRLPHQIVQISHAKP